MSTGDLKQAGYARIAMFCILLAACVLVATLPIAPSEIRASQRAADQKQGQVALADDAPFRTRIVPVVVATEAESILGDCARLNRSSLRARDAERLINVVDGHPICGYRLDVSLDGKQWYAVQKQLAYEQARRWDGQFDRVLLKMNDETLDAVVMGINKYSVHLLKSD